MAEKRRKRRKDELERQKGGKLPKREVMSVLSTSPGVISIPVDPIVEDPLVAQPPSGEDETVPPPNYDT